ncbi:alkaline phosphatase family protein [Hymenobacter oligotrophus]|uniref:Alkaline phosphatase family protein n=1 Tax=Hymenobacter oligotrophus TaxID=2319843 RepID=A0A3B7RCH3_9BACT|nr:alkaline phosphatase D family protein [Hymenobacter oligotrophus]AYA38631.1 alkaline phosphatase family protein [Hymenobacter oligotrophus]
MSHTITFCRRAAQAVASLFLAALGGTALAQSAQPGGSPAAVAPTQAAARATAKTAKPKPVRGATALLRSGPMVGYSEMREVMLWVQTTAPATTYIEYWEKGKPDERFQTDEVETDETTGLVAHLLANKVQPGRRYEYALYLNRRPVARPYPLEFQSQELWQWRKDPANFRMAMGSCTYVNEPAYDRPGAPYAGDYGIFTAIDQQKPDLMLWLGDNVYLREADWNTRTGIWHRNAHTRALPEMQPLLAHTHNYALWDDHDYGPNDSGYSFAHKQLTLEAFKQFWANPNYEQGGGGITGTFQWNDVQFFLMDDRWLRAANKLPTANASYLGESQVRWLLDALASSTATFKFVAVGGQVLNPAKVFENYSNYEQERSRLLEAIAAARIPGVIFLSGDRHHTELTRLERSNGYPLYDLTVSPLTSAPALGARDEANTSRVNGTLVTQRNFAILDVSGPHFDRRLQIRIHDAKGKLIWEQSLAAKELR